MASAEPDRETSLPEPRDRAGLRLRLWLGCLGGALATGIGVWWAASPMFLGEVVDPAALITRLSTAVAIGVAIGFLLAVWVDRGVVAAIRRIARGLAARELPIENGVRPWGELGDLASSIADLLHRHRHLARRAADFDATRDEIATAREAVEYWIREERWMPLRVEEESMRDLAEALNRGLARRNDLDEQNREAAQQIGADLQAATEEARESSSQAERGFVEASALLTTVRELQRIGAELAPSIARRTAHATPSERELWRGRAAEVIQELIRASSDSVESLGGGLLRVQAVADRVQVLSNRATLIALNAVVAGAAASDGEPVEELKALAREVRDATSQVDTLAREIEERVVEATARMNAVRQSAAERLAGTHENAAPDADARRLPEEAERLVERLKELVLEAAATGERMSVAGERASTTADHLVRRLSSTVSDLEGLMVRLSPPRSSDGVTDLGGD